MNDPLIYVAGPWARFHEWCVEQRINVLSPAISYLGDSPQNFSALNLPSAGVAIVNLGDEEMGHRLRSRCRVYGPHVHSV